MIETSCTKCSAALMIPNELVGTEVRCPQCEYTFTAAVKDKKNGNRLLANSDDSPSTSSIIEDESSQDSPEPQESDVSRLAGIATSTPVASKANSPKTDCLYFLRIPEGNVYGPIDREKLDRWVSEGRVARDCQVRANSEPWAGAAKIYPMLAERGNPFASASLRTIEQVRRPGRGKTIFSLALLGCLIPPLAFWSARLGTRDLLDIRRRLVKSDDVMLVRAGQAIAIVSCVIWIAAFAAILLGMIVSVSG